MVLAVVVDRCAFVVVRVVNKVVNNFRVVDNVVSGFRVIGAAVTGFRVAAKVVLDGASVL